MASSLYPFAAVLALTLSPFCPGTHLDLITVLWCAFVKLLKETSVYTCCAFIDVISCFILSFDCSLFNPSVFLTRGSSRIFSVVASCSSLLDRTLISCPFFVVTVTAVILVLVVGGSCVVSGLAGAVCYVDVLCCLDALPSATSSATSRFDVGIGNSNGALALCVDGAVAIGASAKAG